MLAMWCWLQPFGQPLILMWICLVSASVISISSSRSLIARLRPIELVMPSLQLSVPGQLTTSVISRGAGLAEAELAEPLPDVVERLVADPAQDEVLLHGAAGVAAGELAHDRGRGRGTAPG